MLFENKGPDACKSMTALTDSPTKSRRFTIKALSFWTAVVIGAVPVAMAEPNFPITAVFFLGGFCPLSQTAQPETTVSVL